MSAPMRLDVFTPDVVAEYTAGGFWDDETLAGRIASHAGSRPARQPSWTRLCACAIQPATGSISA